VYLAFLNSQGTALNLSCGKSTRKHTVSHSSLKMLTRAVRKKPDFRSIMVHCMTFFHTPARLDKKQLFMGRVVHILISKDGKPELVQAASVSIHGPHGQHVENVHLQPYSSEEHFWNVLYKDYRKLLTKAESFLSQSSSTEDTLFLIRCHFCSSKVIVLISMRFAVVVLMPANMNTRPCRGMAAKCRFRSTTILLEMLLL
jgi:hypothetical protein